MAENASSDVLVSFKGVQKSYDGESLIVKDLNLDIRKGEILSLIGPNGAGKTTLARHFIDVTSPHYFDLEDPVSRQRLTDPMTTLAGLQGLVVIDEVQHLPALPETLRVLMDRPGQMHQNGQYLLLGSASPRVMHKSESLLGRAVTLELSGFDIGETGTDAHTVQQLWLRGGFPAAYLAPDDAVSTQWRTAAIQRHVSSDLPLLGMNAPAPLMTRFWQMLAHYHGQTWNAAEPARSLGITEPTVRRYLDYLTQTFMVRQLQPWHANLAKRQVKAPKIYFRDTGLLQDRHRIVGGTAHCPRGDCRLDAIFLRPASGCHDEGVIIDADDPGKRLPHRVVGDGGECRCGGLGERLAVGVIRGRGNTQSDRGRVLLEIGRAHV